MINRASNTSETFRIGGGSGELLTEEADQERDEYEQEYRRRAEVSLEPEAEENLIEERPQLVDDEQAHEEDEGEAWPNIDDSQNTDESQDTSESMSKSAKVQEPFEERRYGLYNNQSYWRSSRRTLAWAD